jgi:hypothetical protein
MEKTRVSFTSDIRCPYVISSFLDLFLSQSSFCIFHCRCWILFSHFITHRDTLTIGTTPLDEWSAHRRDLYLQQHATLLTRDRHPSPLMGFFCSHCPAFCLFVCTVQHAAQTSMPPAGIKPATPASDRQQTLVLDSSATVTGPCVLKTCVT